MCNITLRSYTREVSDAMEEMLREVIDVLCIHRTKRQLTHENEQWGVSYELNPGWKEDYPGSGCGHSGAVYACHQWAWRKRAVYSQRHLG